LISDVIVAIDVYERTAGLFQQSFEGIVWGLKVRGGRAVPDDVLSDQRLARHLGRTRVGLNKIVPPIERALESMRVHPSVGAASFIEPLRDLRDLAKSGGTSVPELADVVLTRHERVQREKAKMVWIERDSFWTLLPGENRVSIDEPPIWQDRYHHPFKIDNAYSILNDLGQVAIGGRDVEE
jgi:hypothetical protein